MAAPSRARGRLVLALMCVALLAYVPLWTHCSLGKTPAPIILTAPARTVVVPRPCPTQPVLSLPPTTGPRHEDADEAEPETHKALVPAVRQRRSPFHVHVVVFTYRRIEGLKRLLTSLANAKYAGDDVTLTIFLDYPKKGKSLADDGTRRFVSEFRWPHGRLNVHRRLVNAGLKQTIMEAWFPPGTDDEAAAFFEDDIEVSPLWYLWATAALSKYVPEPAHADERLLGVSLFRPVHDELSGRGCKVKNGNKAFALQQPCSWGALYLPKPWRAFRDWYDTFTATGDRDPVVMLPDGSEPSSNTWARTSSWKKYLIKLMAARAWYMVYPNPPQRAVLATNHLMKGEHPTPPKALFELPVLHPESAAFEEFVGAEVAAKARSGRDPTVADFAGTLPALEEMWVYDLMFRRVESRAALPKGDFGP